MKKIIYIVLIVVVAAFLVGFFVSRSAKPQAAITTFEECVAAGNPVMESYPEQCRAGNQTFTRNVGNVVEKGDMIRLTSPRPGDTVRSPLVVTGEARGGWYFEATFPVIVTDWDGLIIGEGYAEAQGEWMTANFVPFKATVTYKNATTTYSNRGTLILKKSNASGLPQNDDALEIPIVLQ